MQHFLAARDCFAGMVDDDVLTLSHLPVISPRMRKLLFRIGRMTIFVPVHCTASASAKSIVAMEQEFASCIVPGEISMTPNTLFSLVPSDAIEYGLRTSRCQGADGDSWSATGTILSPSLSPAPGVKLYLYCPASEKKKKKKGGGKKGERRVVPWQAAARSCPKPRLSLRQKGIAVRANAFAHLVFSAYGWRPGHCDGR